MKAWKHTVQEYVRVKYYGSGITLTAIAKSLVLINFDLQQLDFLFSEPVIRRITR